MDIFGNSGDFIVISGFPYKSRKSASYEASSILDYFFMLFYQSRIYWSLTTSLRISDNVWSYFDTDSTFFCLIT